MDTKVDKKVKKKKTSKTKAQPDDEEPIKSTGKAKMKRKNGTTDSTAEESLKKSKIDESGDIENPEDQTEDKKLDSKKPNAASKRQLKKDKLKLKEAEQLEQCRQEATKKALNYLSMWKHARSNWKFEKLKQIWLMDHLLDDKSVPDSIFPTVLEYFESCKGMARQTLLKKGMDVIKKNEQQLENSEEVVENVEYLRARQLLQALPTDT